MLKSVDLIKRKEELQVKKKDILKEIDELCADMERKSLEDFIKTGNAEQVDGHRLELLQRKHKHLINLEGSLSLEIGRLRKKERLSSLQKLERKAAELEKKRKGALYERYLHFQKKIKILEAESIKLKEERLQAESDAREFRREIAGDLNFRLPGLEQFLKEHYVQKPEELEKLVEEAYRENEIRLRQTVTMIVGGKHKTFTIGKHKLVIASDQLIRGFQKIDLNRDTGEIEKIEPLTCDLDRVRDNPTIMSEVRK